AAQQIAERQKAVAESVSKLKPAYDKVARMELRGELVGAQAAIQVAAGELPKGEALQQPRETALNKAREAAQSFAQNNPEAAQERSEERRVGKERKSERQPKEETIKK